MPRRADPLLRLRQLKHFEVAELEHLLGQARHNAEKALQHYRQTRTKLAQLRAQQSGRQASAQTVGVIAHHYHEEAKRTEIAECQTALRTARRAWRQTLERVTMLEDQLRTTQGYREAIDRKRQKDQAKAHQSDERRQQDDSDDLHRQGR